jgi:hypothetical protein
VFDSSSSSFSDMAAISMMRCAEARSRVEERVAKFRVWWGGLTVSSALISCTYYMRVVYDDDF